jgi:hypothetical protein
MKIDVAVGEVVITDMHPETLWEPGHEIYDWAEEIRRDLEVLTKGVAPGGAFGEKYSTARYPRIGTGRLNAGISASMTRTGPQSIDMAVTSSAPYTMYVHGGTAYQRGGYIYSNLGWANKATIDALMAARLSRPKISTNRFETGQRIGSVIPARMRGLFMSLPPGGGQYWRYHMRVRGQRANPFLIRGYNRAAIQHEALGELWTGVVGL